MDKLGKITVLLIFITYFRHLWRLGAEGIGQTFSCELQLKDFNRGVAAYCKARLDDLHPSNSQSPIHKRKVC